MRRRPPASSKAGFTLVEIMLAVIILATALTVIYRAIIIDSRMVALSRERQEVAYVFSLGDFAHPIHDIEDIEEDVPVDPDYSLKEGYAYSRTVDEKPDPEDGVEDDGLYTVRTIVTWNDGNSREEVVRYLRLSE